MHRRRSPAVLAAFAFIGAAAGRTVYATTIERPGRDVRQSEREAT
jgi:hypothetical protein